MMKSRGRILTVFALAVVAVLLLSATLMSEVAEEEASDEETVSITGLVDTELTLSLAELRSRASTSVVAELICVSGQSFGIHNWTGVKLKDLLVEASVGSNAIKVAFHSADNYSTDLTMGDAMRDDVIVAVLKDGAPLKEGTQLVVPGKWGYKWISGITDIELLDYDFKGTWERAGYSDDANIRTMQSNHGSYKLP